MFESKINAILTAIRSRAAAYTAAADAIETAAAECKAARQDATDRIAAAVLVITAEADMMTGEGQDAVFNAILDTAVGTLGVESSVPATTPDVAVSPAKPARKRGKSKVDVSAAIATGTGRVLVVSYGKGVRVVTEDGTYHDLSGTVDEYTVTFSHEGLTVFTDYPSWDARPVA